MALTQQQITARNAQIQAAQAAIRSGDTATAQKITSSLIGGASVGGAQAALQGAINQARLSAPGPSTGWQNNPGGKGDPLPIQPISEPSGGGGGTSRSSSAPNPVATAPPPPPPTPVVLQWQRDPTFQSGVKQAEPDTVLNSEVDTTGDYIVDRFFQDLGGTELISISRHDLIDGIDVSYNPIANLSRLRQEFNPNNIISIDVLSQNEFAQSTINLLSRGIYEPYLDNDGNLVVEVDIIKPEENINIQIAESGTVTRIEL